MSVTTYDVADDGVALLQLDRPEARNAINTAMLEELLEHLADARATTTRCARSWSPRPTTWASRPAPTSASSSTRRAGCGGCSSSPSSTTSSPASRSRPSPPATAPASAAAPRSRSPATCASAARTCACASPAPRSACPVGPARLVTLCGLSVAKYLLLTVEGDRGRRRPTAGASSTRSRRRREPRRRRSSSPPQVAEHPPEAVARLKRMLHEWDGVEDRSRAEGEGQVEWQRSGPGLPAPE